MSASPSQSISSSIIRYTQEAPGRNVKSLALPKQSAPFSSRDSQGNGFLPVWQHDSRKVFLADRRPYVLPVYRHDQKLLTVPAKHFYISAELLSEAPTHSTR